MHKIFSWGVIGAGPAGIATVGKLLDKGIPAHDILWVDPYFQVGDFGRLWSQVSSNTRAKLFVDFLNALESFNFAQVAKSFPLSHVDPDVTCKLAYMAEPLQWVTDKFRERVVTQTEHIRQISLRRRSWVLTGEKNTYAAKSVVLATGAVPSNLNYPGVDIVPFATAMNPVKLQKTIDPQKTYGVFGSSHSAMIAIRSLVELDVAKVINFYRSPCRYAVDMGDWILFDNTGLKGDTALWTREHIDGEWPKNLQRVHASEDNISKYLPQCDHVVYAVGFDARKNLVVGDHEEIHYNPYTGIIGPGLFGIGIAFPELKTDPLGNVESQVGLWKFMVYLNKIIDLWFKYPA
ncbi:MAG: pyridine nucleotide-disulfide oxidoreductase [Legionella sp. 40-6]|mgnify:CR=1 FL=1|nr:FAD-dependent oxidoreductase [Legionella sp.]OJY12643.1 MAG: pyridine nucleotide-disulfide oxidoreductase [Legionella sp. 40-6]